MHWPVFTSCWLLTVAGWFCRPTSGSQILALFINGHRSHLLFYASIVNLLVDHGHNVTIITTNDFPSSRITSTNLRWIKLSSNYTKSRALAQNNALDKIEAMLSRIDNTAEFMKDPIWKSFMLETEHHFDLMILGYLFNDYQLGVAAHFKCPVVIVWTGQPIGFVHSLMGNPEERWYVPQPYDRNQFRGLKGIAFGWFEKFVEILALHKMHQIYSEQFSHPQYPTFWDVRKNVSLALCNHHSLSEGPIAPFVPGIIEIGGLEYGNRTDDDTDIYEKEMQDILKADTNVIYVSFGSRVKWSNLDPNIEEIFVQAFQYFPEYTIIWTYDKNCKDLINNSSNIRCKPWWPQSHILASNNTKLFITHGGKGSISEVYRYGKPLMGVPFFGDQRANVARIEQRKMGLQLNIHNLSLDGMVNALQQLLHNEEYHDNAKTFSLLYRDRPMNSERTLIYWLEYVIRHKGAHYLRSSSLNMNVIEYYNIDTYTVIILTLIVITVVFKWLERKIKGQ
ncbi:UDP-glycosyltransferase family 307 member A1 [Haematobia irritans]|uniref:UDP-glycosyltransferase family 307 member A1 n=1 Tax=Haematobia irritans TaxID=7368 RepID=UPI003F4F6B5D